MTITEIEDDSLVHAICAIDSIKPVPWSTPSTFEAILF